MRALATVVVTRDVAWSACVCLSARQTSDGSGQYKNGRTDRDSVGGRIPVWFDNTNNILWYSVLKAASLMNQMAPLVAYHHYLLYYVC